MFDIAIIGAGIVGALTARNLSRFDLKICVFERSNDVSTGASGANSGIIHAGFDAAEGSLKARYNILGVPLIKNIIKELGVKYLNTGSLVLALSKEDEDILKKLQKRGIENKAEKTYIIDKEKIGELEPNVNKSALSALWAPSSGIICPYGLNIAAMGNAMDNGVQLKTDFEVVNIEKNKNGFTLFSKSGEKADCKIIINCAGLYADKIANLLNDTSFKIGAKKGEYILLDKDCKKFVNSTVFNCPSDKGKGVLISQTVDGNIIVGPTSVFSCEKEDNSIVSEAFEYITGNAKKLCPELPLNSVITSFCGVRAYSDRHDFIIEYSNADNRLINVAGIESPGLTASPAIAQKAAEMALGLLNNVKKNELFNPVRTSDHFFKNLSKNEKNELIKHNPDYGKIVCRCEEVTLGEILFSINRNPKAQTIDGIKRRTRAGMGRCQGGFCHPSVTQILHSNLNIGFDDILKNNEGSWVFAGKQND